MAWGTMAWSLEGQDQGLNFFLSGMSNNREFGAVEGQDVTMVRRFTLAVHAIEQG